MIFIRINEGFEDVETSRLNPEELKSVTLNLEDAAKIFLQQKTCQHQLQSLVDREPFNENSQEVQEQKVLKTIIRRLYDIANVLTSIGILEKVTLQFHRRPSFRWRGKLSSVKK